MSDKQKLESMLFNRETTYRTDFVPYKITAPVKTLYKGKPPRIRPKYTPIKDIHTLCHWDQSLVPFDLMIKQKEVVRDNPQKMQEAYEKPIDHDLKQIQKTRPRLVMTPAVSMDDIADEKARELLLRDIYTTTLMRANAEAVAPCNKVLTLKYPAPPHPITLQRPRPCVVPPQWRFESVGWDGKQLRSYVDPTKEFWLNRPQK